MARDDGNWAKPVKTLDADDRAGAISGNVRGRRLNPANGGFGRLFQKTFTVRIVDNGGGREIPEAQTPDLEAKLAGLQKPRGWGLFLIKNMVDDLRTHTTETHHTIELVMRLGETRPVEKGTTE